MARYSIRDLLGHFVRLPPASNEDGMCPHACCRGKRPHPDKLPVMLSRSTLRSLSTAELEAHYQRESVGKNGRAVSQVIRELDRRERAAETKAHRAAARGARADEHRAYLEHQWIAAESATRGVMLNRKGVKAGIDPRSLWTSARARDRYASDELRSWFDRNPPVSLREFGSERGQARGAQRARERQLYGVY
jgi:hypothetical protein